MLFKEIHLNGIKSRKINLAFRKWQKATVQTGSLLHTAIGLVEIGKIETITEQKITEKDALNAGFANKEQLLKSFPKNSAGTIFKIAVSYHSEDPRIKLREQAALSAEQLAALKKKLEKLDNLSKQGNWTSKVLLAIESNPNLHAIGISKITGFEKEWLKLHIRKLKNLGLTISHTVGYEISPFGKLFIEKMKDRNSKYDNTL